MMNPLYLCNKAVSKLDEKLAKRAVTDREEVEKKRAEYRKLYESRTCIVEEEEQETLVELQWKPLISILVPVYNVANEYLTACIESVKAQTYDNWELCLVDDCSPMESVRETLRGYEGQDRIRISYRTENGNISKCTNTALEMAAGEYVAFLDCDDIITENALYEMVKAVNENPNLDFVYSDEDKIMADGSYRHMPHYKPDWSPDTFMSFMYTSHFSMYRTSIAKQIGGFRSECDGAQDYDFTLRFTEQTKEIGHVPKILYHWREIEGSTAGSTEAKPYVVAAQKKAKEDAVLRRGQKAKLALIPEINQLRVIYQVQGNPKVSIVIPSKDNYDILKRCVESLISLTAYKNYEIVLVDNGSAEECRKRYEELADSSGKRMMGDFIYHYEKMEFNFSHMCNLGAGLATGEYLLFLNDDIEIINEDWLTILLGQAQLDHAGAVGAKLYYPDSMKIQHSGVIKIADGPAHAFGRMEDDKFYYFGRNRLDFNYLAVTGACLLVAAEKFRQVDGFEEGLPVAYNDVDLCYKLYEAGYYNVVRNDAILYHHESISRGYDWMDPKKKERLDREKEKLYERHPGFADYDPFYNIHLAPHATDFSFNMEQIFCKQVEIPKNIKNSMHQQGHIEHVVVDEHVAITGWLFDRKWKNNNATRHLILLERMEGKKVVERKAYEAIKRFRVDVGDLCPERADVDFSGFYCRINGDDLADGAYRLKVISIGEDVTCYYHPKIMRFESVKG